MYLELHEAGKLNKPLPAFIMSNRPPAAFDWFLLLVLTLIWGASFLFIKHSVAIFSSMQMTMWRLVLALIIYVPVAVIFWSKIDWKRWKPLAVVAFCGSAIPNFFFAVAQKQVSSSLAGVLNALTPLFTLTLGVLFFQMAFKRDKLLGVLLGLVGAAILILYNASSAVSGNWFYALLCAGGALCYAINANVVNNHLRDLHPAAIASAAFILTGWIFLLGLWWSGGWSVAWEHPEGWKGLGLIFYLAALGTVGGSILYFWLMQRTSAVFATSVTYLLPVAALALGALDGEVVGLADLAGTGIILAGVYLARK
ncbi:MAG: EamA family transporter [Lewinellaceae bacterium]|nr:EamA family transporter [Saprospiraceae bacterium]MCB9333828.1 EamA family transporter [Lewinellaceae bacterium]